MSLQAFMMQNVKPVEAIKRVISDRFVDKGEVIPFEFKAITSDEEMRIRKASMITVSPKGKHGMPMQQLDQNMFMAKLAAACVVYPDLKNEALQNSYGVRGDDLLLKTMLLPGEYAEVLLVVQEINGYDKDMNALIEEAKN